MSYQPLSIGKTPENQIVFSHPSISRHHATLHYLDESTLVFEDHSTNGTTINGLRVQRSKLKRTDHLSLGDLAVSSDLLFNQAFRIWKTDQSDYSTEFASLIPLYKEYEKKQKKISTQSNIIGNYLRLGISGTILVVLFFIPKEVLGDVKNYLMIGSGVFISLFGLSAGRRQAQVKERLELLQADFERKLICPKCMKGLIHRSLAYYQRTKSCPHCQAKFIS